MTSRLNYEPFNKLICNQVPVYFKLKTGEIGHIISQYKENYEENSIYNLHRHSYFDTLKNIKNTYVSTCEPLFSEINFYENDFTQKFNTIPNGSLTPISVIYECNNGLYGKGDNLVGELGIGEDVLYTDKYTKIPIKFSLVSKIFRTKKIECLDLTTSSERGVNGFFGTIFIMKDGTVKGCGTNLYGYEGTTQYNIVDLQLTNVKNVFYTRNQWFFVFNNNEIKAMGDNTSGKLGVGSDDTYINELRTVPLSGDGLIDIKTQYNTTMFLYDNGNLCFSGENIKTYDFYDGYNYLINGSSFKTNIPTKSTLINNIKKIENYISESTNDYNKLNILLFLSNNGYIIYSTLNPDIEFENSYFKDGLNSKNNILDITCVDGRNMSLFLYDDSSFQMGSNVRYDLNMLEEITIQDSIKTVYSVENSSNFNNNITYDFCPFKSELWNNNVDILGDINKDWIDKITYKYNTEISSFQLKVPKYVGGEKQINTIYQLIKSNQQVRVTNTDGTVDVFVLKEQVVDEEKEKGEKTYTAYGLQKKLEDIQVKVPQNNYLLYRDDNDDISNEGILNIIEEQTRWSIGYVDTDAKNEITTTNQVNKDINAINNLSGTIDWNEGHTQYSVNIYNDKKIASSNTLMKTANNSVGKEPLYLTITYNNVMVNTLCYKDFSGNKLPYYTSNCYIGVDDTVAPIRFGNIIHTFDEPFYDDIVSFFIYYCDQVGNRNSIKYVFTLKNGDTKTVIMPFVNAIGNLKEITWDTSIMQHTTGIYVKQSNPIYPYFDATEDTSMKILTDISDVFNVAFKFDTINKFIHVYSLSSLGNGDGEGSSKIGQFILGNSKLGTNDYDNIDAVNLMLSFNDIISVNKTDTDSEIINGLKITNSNNISIVNVNPNGTNIIEDWSYFINKGLLTDSCKSSMLLYNEFLKYKQTHWNVIQKSYIDNSNTLITYESQIKSYQEHLLGLRALLNGYMDAKDTANINSTQSQITDTQNKLDAVNNNKLAIQDNINALTLEMSEYANTIKKENAYINSEDYSSMTYSGKRIGYIFTESDLNVLYDLISVETISDDYFTNDLALYEHYSQIMVDKTKPKVQLVTKTGNMYKYIYYNNKIISIGSWYELDDKLKKVFDEKRIRLISFEYYPNKGKYGSYENLTFSNKISSINKLRKFKTISSAVSKTTQTVSNLSNAISTTSSGVLDKFSQYSGLIQQQLNNVGMLQTQTKGSTVITLNANESTKTVDIINFIDGTFTVPPTANIYCEANSSIIPLPYMRFDTNYIFDIATPFNLIITANITKDKITVECNRSKDASTVSESFIIDYVVFKE